MTDDKEQHVAANAGGLTFLRPHLKKGLGFRLGCGGPGFNVVTAGECQLRYCVGVHAAFPITTTNLGVWNYILRHYPFV